MSKEILLQLKDIRVHYGGVKALDGVDVAIDEGEIVALMGAERVWENNTY